MKHLFNVSIFVLLLSFSLSACEESDKFSTDPNLQLEYSAEALNFDTVFTTIASPFQSLKVYNRNNNSIIFESIKLMNPEKSGFRINVDGLSGTEFRDIDLLRKDSIFVRVDAKLNSLDGSDANVKDYIEFSWNGNTKYVELGAYGIDVEVWDNKTIDSDMHLTADKGYYIRDKVIVNEAATVTIEEGTNFYFDRKGALEINGTLVARGAADKRITFRGHRFDLIERNVPYNNVSGQWVGISIGKNSFDNVFDNVTVRSAQTGMRFAKSTPEKRKATLNNTIIHSSLNDGLNAVKCDIEATNCQFSNSGGSLLTLVGGSYSFLHCTIANYYQWGDRLLSSVILSEGQSDEKYPFKKCLFANSIIVGTFYDEIELYVDANNKSIQFINCLIQASAPINDERFVDTIWNIGSLFFFKDLNSKRNYSYNFELLEGSAAIDAANLDYAQQAPTDLRGISRLEDGKPDIGCYEWFYTGGNE